MSDDKRCGTCRWWECREYTPTGRPKRNTPGACGKPVELPQMPSCVSQPVYLSRLYMWIDDGTDCACYERKERDEANGEGTD